jgi:DNA-binding CsgD family transcriptional regulator
MSDQDPGLDLTHALQQVTVPAYVLALDGRFRWLNRGAIELLGDRVGQPFWRSVAPEDLHLVRAHFAKKLIGEAALTEYDLTLLTRDCRRLPARVSSVPLRKCGEIVGVFGVTYPSCAVSDQGAGGRHPDGAPELTARQYETLALLANGLGTVEIAARLGVAEETARNHIRGLFRQLDVHSRLEAVVCGYRLGLLDRRRDN